MAKKIKIPVKEKKVWFCSFLNKNGTTTKSSTAGHVNEKSCINCCDNYNKFIGYKKKEVKQIIKDIQDGKEKGKGKSKKSKKAKNKNN